MPHVLTRTRAVVGGGLLAVLLLACFGASVGAQGEKTPAPPFVVEIETSVSISETSTYFGPGQIAGSKKFDQNMMATERHWCRTQTVTERARPSDYISTAVALQSSTEWCWNGTKLSYRNPRFTHDWETWYDWKMVSERYEDDGEIGDWEHWDWAKVKFENCVNVHPWVCDWTKGKITLDIRKTQRGDGSYSPR